MKNALRATAAAVALFSALNFASAAEAPDGAGGAAAAAPEAGATGEATGGAAGYARFKARVAAIEDAAGIAHADVDAAVTAPGPVPMPLPESGAAKDRPSAAPQAAPAKPTKPTEPNNSPAPSIPAALRAAGAPEITRIVDLNVSTLRAVGTSDGDMLFVADMGRYVLKGQLLDVWQKKALRTIDEVAQSVGRIDLAGIGYESSRYAHYAAGTGARDVVLFVDPRCGWCHRLLDEIESDEALRSEYRFLIHVVPVLGEASNALAKRLWCAKAGTDEKLAALLKGSDAVNALPAQTDCRLEEQDRTVFLSGLLGIRSVPFLIAPDGRTSNGKPADLRAFLENDRESAMKKLREEAPEETSKAMSKEASKETSKETSKEAP